MHKAIIAVLLASVPAGLFAQAAQPQTAAPATAKPYSSATTDIGTLIDDPAAKAVLDKHIPGFSGNPQVAQARSFTLKAVQQFAPDMIKDEVLAAIDADLAKLPPKK